MDRPPSVKRRDALALLGGAATVAAALSSGCSPLARNAIVRQKRKNDRSNAPAPLPQTGDIHPIARLLNRAAFGPAPGDVAHVAATGVEAWVDKQLGAPTDGDDPEEAAYLPVGLGDFGVVHASPYDLQDLGEKDVLRQLTQAAILRAVYSPWQVRERMVDFWSNHFNLYGHKNMGAFLLPTDTMAVIRANALGTFPALLSASAHSPAMLGYLDNEQNKKGVANENYARELMELHTLGVGGGYSQKDVAEVARCLTGWTIEQGFLKRKGTFKFDADRHDDGDKMVLGHPIKAGGGQSDGDQVLHIVSHHPATARFISKKLVRYFVGTNDSALVEQTAATYTKTGGDIRAMIKPLLLSPALVASPPVMKRPFDFMVSALRAARCDTDGGADLQNHLAQMGQGLWEWPMPDGYPDQTGAWTGSLLHRWNFAGALTSGSIKNTGAEWNQTAATAHDALQNLLAARADDPAHSILLSVLSQHATPAERAALVFASPAFQWR